MSDTAKHTKWTGELTVTYEAMFDEPVDEATARQRFETATFRVADAANQLPMNVGGVRYLESQWRFEPAENAS